METRWCNFSHWSKNGYFLPSVECTYKSIFGLIKVINHEIFFGQLTQEIRIHQLLSALPMGRRFNFQGGSALGFYLTSYDAQINEAWKMTGFHGTHTNKCVTTQWDQNWFLFSNNSQACFYMAANSNVGQMEPVSYFLMIFHCLNS